MAKKYACSPFQSLGNCCLEKLEFIQLQDITPTTDIFIILDNSGSFSGQRAAYVEQIKSWYSSFRADNSEYLGNVYFYSASYDTLEKQSVFAGSYIAPMVGTKTDLILKNISIYNRLTPIDTTPYPIVFDIRVDGTHYIFDNTLLQSNDWSVILEGLAIAMNNDSVFAVDSLSIVTNNTLIICAQNRSIVDWSNQFVVGDSEYPPLLTSLYADGLDSPYTVPSNFTTDENWLNKPKKLLGESSRFTAMGFKIPLETLLIYIGDEAALGGAYYHGPNLIVSDPSNTTGYDRKFADLFHLWPAQVEYTVASLHAESGVLIESSSPNNNAIQSTVLSDPYRTVILPTWGETVVGGGYKEHYDEFVNTYYHKFKFFRGIVYGLSNSNGPYSFADLSTRNVYHSFLYQAIEPYTVSEEDFIESSFAKDLYGNSTGLSLAFIKERNYLAEAGYGGLKNYGWKEYHNVGYGTNVTSYFTPEIFQANIDKALLNGDNYILQGTLSNGIVLESNKLNIGGVKTTQNDLSAGVLVDKIVAGDNVTITVVDNKLVVASDGGGAVEEELTVTVNIANAGYQSGDIIPIGTTTTEFIKELLCPYTSSAFALFSLSFNISGDIEIGRSVTVINANWSFINDSEGNPLHDVHITGTGYNAAIILTGTSAVPNSTPVEFTKSTANTEIWSISGQDKNDVYKVATVNKIFRYMHRVGASILTITDSISAQTVIDSLTNNILTSGKTRTIICNSDNADVTKKTYICYDSSFGALSNIIQNGALPVLTAFTRLADYSYINQYGVTRTMIIYESNSTGAFASGTTLTLS